MVLSIFRSRGAEWNYSNLYSHNICSSGKTKTDPPERKEEIQKYITGIIQNHNQKLIAINSMPDHIHILIGVKLIYHYLIS